MDDMQWNADYHDCNDERTADADICSLRSSGKRKDT
jgi:hypothetical protein